MSWLNAFASFSHLLLFSLSLSVPIFVASHSCSFPPATQLSLHHPYRLITLLKRVFCAYYCSYLYLGSTFYFNTRIISSLPVFWCTQPAQWCCQCCYYSRFPHVFVTYSHTHKRNDVVIYQFLVHNIIKNVNTPYCKPYITYFVLSV